MEKLFLKISTFLLSLLIFVGILASTSHAQDLPPEQIILPEFYIAAVKSTLILDHPEIPALALNYAIDSYYYLQPILNNQKYLTVIDFTASSKKKRMHVINMKTWEVTHYLVAHGQGSGGEYATQFSNVEDSLQSSVGLFITTSTYTGDNGLSLKLDGRSRYLNTNALERFIVMHGADYATPTWLKSHAILGRSWGCPAVDEDLAPALIKALKGGSLLFIYSDRYKQFAQFNPADILE